MTSGEKTPQDIAMILTPFVALLKELEPTFWSRTVSPFRSHDLRRLSRRRGVASRSLSVTWAPHLPATRPGTAVPAPSCEQKKEYKVAHYIPTVYAGIKIIWCAGSSYCSSCCVALKSRRSVYTWYVPQGLSFPWWRPSESRQTEPALVHMATCAVHSLLPNAFKWTIIPG